MATKCTVWSVLKAASKYDGSPTAHKDVIAKLKEKGHSAKMSDAWCTETIMAIMYDAGCIDLVGGYSQTSGDLKKKAQKNGIWHSGSNGILPGDIVVFGRNGKSNHTELAVGNDLDISGNYKMGSTAGCYRRRRSSHSSDVLGYVRPKYSPMPDMDNLQTAIVATDCILGVYGAGETRKKLLAVFGDANAKNVSRELERVYESTNETSCIMAASAVAGFLGNSDYREKRLGNWAGKVQDKINAIYALRGRTVTGAAQLVLENRFGTNAIRSLFLKFCGYDPKAVQEKVNELLRPAKENEKAPVNGSLISLFRGSPRPSKDIDGLQGDCWILKSGKSALIGDTMKAGALDRIVAEIKDCDNVCLYFSHEHGDHMSSNGNSMIKKGLIKKCYVPAEETISKDQKYQNRYKKLLNDCKSHGVEVVKLKQGSKFSVGSITAEVLFQQTGKMSDSINMHSLCTLFKLGDVTYLACGDHHCGEKESKFRIDRKVTIYKSSHHQLFTGDTQSFVESISPDWIIGSGWQSWPNATVGKDPKTKRAQKNYQRVGNLIPGDVCGRTELVITGGVVTAKAERNMVGRTVKYVLDGKTYQKTVHVCNKTTFHAVPSMVPTGAKII